MMSPSDGKHVSPCPTSVSKFFKTDGAEPACKNRMMNDGTSEGRIDDDHICVKMSFSSYDILNTCFSDRRL